MTTACVFVVVGLKCDLEEKRQVPIEEGERVAKELKCPFLEVSSLTMINFDSVFELLARELWKIRARLDSY